MKFLYCVFLLLVISVVLLDLGAAKCKTRPKPKRTKATCTTKSKPYPAGTVCNYACFPKKWVARPKGTTVGTTRTCLPNGSWTGTDLICELAKRCSDPDPGNPKLPPCTNRFGCNSPFRHCDECNYQCVPPCKPTGGNAVRSCYDGAWSGTTLQCKKDCDPPPMPPGTTHSGCTAPYTHGTVCNYDCKTGYSETGGDDSLTCNDGNWDGEELECKKNCNQPPRPNCASITGCNPGGPIYEHGSTCDYQCDFPCSKTGGDDTLTCTDGNWLTNQIECQQTTPAPYVIWG